MIIILFASCFCRDITYEISVEAVSTMVVFLSCQLFHKEVLRQSISHKYLMRGRWYVSILHVSTFFFFFYCTNLCLGSCPLILMLSQMSRRTFPSVILSTLQTPRISNPLLLSCLNCLSSPPLSSPSFLPSQVVSL